MVATVKQLTVRSAEGRDIQRLANLIHFETHVHRHLDWRPPLDWVGSDPYLIAESGGSLVAALACPPDPQDVSWIRLFAVSSEFPLQDAWDDLWPAALEQVHLLKPPVEIAAIPLQGWFRKLVEGSGFSYLHRVVVLVSRGEKPPAPKGDTHALVRAMSIDDLPAVQEVDWAAFTGIWRNSLESLEMAYRQAAIATVAEQDGKVVGYQISTASPMGGHLARLAVHPNQQPRGIRRDREHARRQPGLFDPLPKIRLYPQRGRISRIPV
jgi:N-acetylglutamate synthase-like GNAT family acetyltransferase